ncbi:MAG: hypothetical protein MUF22_00965, partial [Chitinispirillaceae bacterium]|nr:hypothetical protein [Chitinispirillaceae bacterium]
DTVPVILGTFPPVARQRKICFTVIDRTPGDEITFYHDIDGSRDSEKGLPNASYCVTLEPGIHTYAVHAKDKAGNCSPVYTGKTAYIETSEWNIRVRRVTGEESLMSDDDPVGLISFTIENLPGDDMRCVREIKVQNKTTGKAETRNTFTDNQLDFDVQLKPRQRNIVVVDVQDINGNKKSQQVQFNPR